MSAMGGKQTLGGESNVGDKLLEGRGKPTLLLGLVQDDFASRGLDTSRFKNCGGSGAKPAFNQRRAFRCGYTVNNNDAVVMVYP